MSKQEMPQNEVRANLTEVINQAAYNGQITVITRRGKATAAIVPLDRIAKESTVAPAFIFHGTVGHTRKGRRIEPARIPPLTGTSQRHRYDINSVEEARDFVQSIFTKDDSIIRIEFSYTLDGERITEEATRPVAYVATVGEENAEWLSGTMGPTAQHDESVRITDLGNGQIRVPADAIEILRELNDSWDGVVDEENGVLRIYIESTAWRLTPAEDE